MARPSIRQYKWDQLTVERLDKLANLLPHKLDEIDIVRDALCNFLSMLERDERPWMTVPSEQAPQARAARRAHKRSPDAG